MSKQQYFLHTTPESSSEKIKSDGFLYVKGRPTVTGSLRLAVSHATEQGYVEKPETKGELWNILCLELPDQKNIKTSVKGNIWVDYEKKKIHGKPNIWMGGKAQGAIYDKGIHHQGKKNIVDRENLERELVSKDKIVLELKRSSELDNFASKLETLLAEFKPVDLEELKKDMLLALKESIIYQKEGIELEVIVEDILFSTFQTNCMEFVRSLFLGQADINGYKMFADKSNGKEEERNMKNRGSYKLIKKFNKYLRDVNKEDFDLFKGSPKYKTLTRYLKSSLNYIDRKFPEKGEIENDNKN